MKTTIIDTPESPNKFWASQDARQRNLNNKSHWPSSAQLRAERMRMAFELVYRVERSYISYGKKSISIKLSNAKVRDAVILASLEHRYETEGVTKKVSNQGVIYTFK